MKRLIVFVSTLLVCTLLAGPGQQMLLPVKSPAGAPPGASFADDFNRTSEFPLSGGGNWSTYLGGLSQVFLLTNLAEGVGGGSETTLGVARVNTSAATFSGNHRARVTLVTGWADYAGPCVKIQSDGSCYLVYQEGSMARVRKVNGTAGTTSTVGTDFSITPATVGQTLALECSGDGGSVTLTVICNGVSQGSVIDSSSPLAGGQPGLFCGLYAQTDGFSAEDI